MLLTWLVGVHGFTAGFETAIYLRGGTAPDVAAIAQEVRGQGDMIQFTVAVLQASQARALSEHQDVAFPLSIANMLLGGLLVIASGLALGGRPGTRGFALQVLAANVAFAAAEYVLTRDVRSALIAIAEQAGAFLPATTPGAPPLDPAFLWTAERVRTLLFELFVLEVFVFAAAALALTRTRTKSYFQGVARLAEPTDEL